MVVVMKAVIAMAVITPMTRYTARSALAHCIGWVNWTARGASARPEVARPRPRGPSGLELVDTMNPFDAVSRGRAAGDAADPPATALPEPLPVARLSKDLTVVIGGIDVIHDTHMTRR